MNISYIKGLLSKASKNTGANINIVELSEHKVDFTYCKNNIYIKVIVTPSKIKKYQVNILYGTYNIQTVIDNLNEVIQGIDLILLDYIKYKTPILLKAVMKANHWGVKLVTVEKPDKSRANLYVSHLLYAFTVANIVNIDNLHINFDTVSYKTKCKYEKTVLNYDKIQKEQSWDKYSHGFENIKQFKDGGNDYIHPSLTWQKTKLF